MMSRIDSAFKKGHLENRPLLVTYSVCGDPNEKKSLENLRKEFENFYSVTDEKFSEKEFNNKVPEEFRLKTKGIEVGHIFYFGDK